MNIVAFDIGDKRIGIAVSSPSLTMALPSETYFRKSFKVDLEYLKNFAESRKADRIVCGLPLNVDGSESLQSVKTKDFVEELRKITDIEIVYEDERFTTLEARRILIEADMRREKRKQVIDKVAASYILENYLGKLQKVKENPNV